MNLTDTQIERYSRQIILPEVGGRGQEALLRSRVSIVGIGELAEAVLPYLAGAGIGSVRLQPAAGEDASAAAKLADRIVSINPDVQVTIGATGSASADDEAPGDLWCEVSGRAASALTLVRAARIARVPTILAGVVESMGWMSVVRTQEVHTGCAFCGWLDARHPGAEGIPSPLAPTVVGTIAALLASCIIEARLELHAGQPAGWLRYDAETMTLTRQTISFRTDCPVCAGHPGEEPCHPTQDS
jgi:adenylyltransferase/sulfurtransferase